MQSSATHSESSSSKAIGNQDGAKQSLPVKDNKPEAIQLKEMKEMTQNSPIITIQRQQFASALRGNTAESSPNETGMPDQLRSGLENMSGFDLSDVKVHYNSSKPAQLQALAFAQGNEIHLGPGQEKHLPHEGWHVVQQRQGRVSPTMHMNGVAVNDDQRLEKEADVVGAKALQIKTKEKINSVHIENSNVKQEVIQNISRRVEESTKNTSGRVSDTIQRKITVGILKYDAKQAETRVKGAGIVWKDVYRQILTSLDVKDERFKNIEELTANLELNGNNLEGYVDGAAKAWDVYEWEPGTKDTLHDLVYKVIVGAITDKTAISEMSYDKIFKYTPETQLAYCLWECKDDTADVLALCLYTSYFYEPLNKYFRGLIEPDESTNFGKLILETAKVLRSTYEDKEATEINEKRYRLELMSDWIEGDEEFLNFGALTSTHPTLDGIKGMWGDVANGTFGEYDNLALLTFEGTAKIKRPTKKYFPSENEDLMGPGAKYNVVDRYVIEGDIPGIIGKKQIRVFRLSNNISSIGSVVEKLSFNDVVPYNF